MGEKKLREDGKTYLIAWTFESGSMVAMMWETVLLL